MLVVVLGLAPGTSGDKVGPIFGRLVLPNLITRVLEFILFRLTLFPMPFQITMGMDDQAQFGRLNNARMKASPIAIGVLPENRLRRASD
jgi:hypothetical protein